MLRLIGFYDYTVILTYLSLLSAIVGMGLSSGGAVYRRCAVPGIFRRV